MDEPTLVPRHALAGVPVGLSVSDSADLAALGLTEKHCELVVAELTRGLLLAGAIVVYGGRLKPAGFTRILLDEVQRFQEGEAAVEIVLAESEYRRMTREELTLASQRLSTLGRIRYISAEGEELRLTELPPAGDGMVDSAAALTAMRTWVAQRTVARVVVGGKLSGFEGEEPGVIEEARLSADCGAVVYPAGGYGGAAAAIALSRHAETPKWVPRRFPASADSKVVQDAVRRFQQADHERPWDGLNESDREILEASHRPADIATLVVRGLARAVQREAKAPTVP